MAIPENYIGGGRPSTGKRELFCEELPPGAYGRIPVLVEHPTGDYETRVLGTGAAPLAVEALGRWRLIRRAFP